jgi:hypothetical protein
MFRDCLVTAIGNKKHIFRGQLKKVKSINIINSPHKINYNS